MLKQKGINANVRFNIVLDAEDALGIRVGNNTTGQWHALNSIRTLAAQSQNSAQKTENKKQNKTQRKRTHE